MKAHLLPSLPSHPPHPLGPSDNVLTPHQPLHGPVIFRQLLVASDPMHEAMASSAEPSNAVQPPFFVPAALDGFGVDLLRDQMVVAQRDPVALADLAGRGAGGGPERRGACCGVDVFLEDWGEELGEVGLFFEETVCFE